jgi:hypothetical protein
MANQYKAKRAELLAGVVAAFEAWRKFEAEEAPYPPEIPPPDDLSEEISALWDSALIVSRAFNSQRVPTNIEASYATAALARYSIKTGEPIPDDVADTPYNDHIDHIRGDAAEGFSGGLHAS